MHTQQGDCPFQHSLRTRQTATVGETESTLYPLYCNNGCALWIKEEYFGYEGCALAAIPFLLGMVAVSQELRDKEDEVL